MEQEKNCTLYGAAEVIGKKWTIEIMLEVYKGKARWKRFSELKKKIFGITQKMLSQRLKMLEREGLIYKRVEAKNFPIKSEYSLSSSGQDFIHILGQIKKWSLKWKKGNKLCSTVRCKDCVL